MIPTGKQLIFYYINGGQLVTAIIHRDNDFTSYEHFPFTTNSGFIINADKVDCFTVWDEKVSGIQQGTDGYPNLERTDYTIAGSYYGCYNTELYEFFGFTI